MASRPRGVVVLRCEARTSGPRRHRGGDEKRAQEGTQAWSLCFTEAAEAGGGAVRVDVSCVLPVEFRV